MSLSLNFKDGVLFFNGREIGEVYECDGSTSSDPIYRCQLYGGGTPHRGFTTKDAAEQSLMDDAVAWLWQLNSDLNAHSVIEALRLILPMAKGYAAINTVGSNQEIVDYAASVLKDADEALYNARDAKRMAGLDEEELPW